MPAIEQVPWADSSQRIVVFERQPGARMPSQFADFADAYLMQEPIAYQHEMWDVIELRTELKNVPRTASFILQLHTGTQYGPS